MIRYLWLPCLIIFTTFFSRKWNWPKLKKKKHGWRKPCYSNNAYSVISIVKIFPIQLTRNLDYVLFSSKMPIYLSFFPDCRGSLSEKRWWMVSSYHMWYSKYIHKKISIDFSIPLYDIVSRLRRLKKKLSACYMGILSSCLCTHTHKKY